MNEVDRYPRLGLVEDSSIEAFSAQMKLSLACWSAAAYYRLNSSICEAAIFWISPGLVLARSCLCIFEKVRSSVASLVAGIISWAASNDGISSGSSLAESKSHSLRALWYDDVESRLGGGEFNV